MLHFHWVDLNKPLGRVSLAVLMKGAVMVHMVDSYESFQSFQFKLSEAPNENIVQNHLNIALLNYFSI